MNRKDVIKKFVTLLDDSDVVVFIGKKLCEEAYLNDKENYIYLLDNFFISASMGIAYALPEKSKLFILFDDQTLIEDFSSMFQVLLSKNINLFLFFLYDNVGLFKKVSHIQGVFFDIGIQSFAIESYFNSTDGLKKLKIFLREMKGPKIYSMGVDISNRIKAPHIDKSPLFFRDRFNLIINKLIGVTPNGL